MNSCFAVVSPFPVQVKLDVGAAKYTIAIESINIH